MDRNRSQPDASEITDIIPFNEFGDLADLDFRDNSAFDRESQVIHAPELDDLDDTDDLIPLRLAVPSEFRRDPRDERRLSHAYRDSHTDTSDGVAATDIIDISGRRGLHRKQDVPVKGRLMVAAMAVGATAAGAYSMANASDHKTPAEAVLAADQSVMGGGVVTGSVDGMQIVSVTPAADTSVHAEEITKAAAFAQERADREARLNRPLFVMYTKGVFTSGFGYRWGVLHGGIDIANAIGTPILAVADGVVIDAGPTAGYGAWVKLRHADGTVTLVRPRQHLAGQQGRPRDGRRPDRDHRQPRQLDRPALPLRGSAQRHQPDRPGAVAGAAGTWPRQLRWLV